MQRVGRSDTVVSHKDYATTFGGDGAMMDPRWTTWSPHRWKERSWSRWRASPDCTRTPPQRP
eukprot:9330610-Pyramimonas_sp.AAC.1